MTEKDFTKWSKFGFNEYDCDEILKIKKETKEINEKYVIPQLVSLNLHACEYIIAG